MEQGAAPIALKARPAGHHAARLRWSEVGARAGAGAGQTGFRPWAEAKAGVFLFLFEFLFSKIPK